MSGQPRPINLQTSHNESSHFRATPTGPGPPFPHSMLGMENPGGTPRSCKRIKIDAAEPGIVERIEMSLASPHTHLSLTSPSPGDAQILSPNTVCQAMDHGSADVFPNEGLTTLKSLNFATAPEDHDDYVFVRKQKTPRDPMSHRIIEKRRRDRMNNCLADLSRLIPPHYIKQGQGRIEKTEIIEMSIKHLKYLHNILPKEHVASTGIEFSKSQVEEDKQKAEKFLMGYKECGTELMRFLMDQEGLTTKDRLFVRVVNYLAEREKNLKQMVLVAGNPTTKSEAKDSQVGETTESGVSGDVQASEPDCDASSVSSRSKTASGSVRSESSGYASSLHQPNRSLRDELRLSEAELEEERKRQSNKRKLASDANDIVGPVESTLRDLLSNPDSQIPFDFESADPRGTTTTTRDGVNKKEETEVGDDNDVVVVDEDKFNEGNDGETAQSRLSKCSTPSEGIQESRSMDFVYNFKKDMKFRFTGEVDNKFGDLPTPELQSTTTTTTTSSSSSSTSSSTTTKPSINPLCGGGCGGKWSSGAGGGNTHINSNRMMRGHNSKDSKDKIMEEHIKMKRIQEQQDRKEDNGCFSSSATPSPPETSSSLSDGNNQAEPPVGIPCFALHPSGTFYVPIAIHPSLVQEAVEKKVCARAATSPLCHPVSIPVNFLSPDNPTGSSFAIHNINVSNVAPSSTPSMPFNAIT